MSQRTYTITAERMVSFTFPGLAEGERESTEIKLEIEYTYSPGLPERGPSYSSGGEPAEPAEVSLVLAKLLDGNGLAPDDAQVQEWADEWLQGDGFDAACQHAEEASQPDPDYLYEMNRDDAGLFLDGPDDEF